MRDPGHDVDLAPLPLTLRIPAEDKLVMLRGAPPRWVLSVTLAACSALWVAGADLRFSVCANEPVLCPQVTGLEAKHSPLIDTLGAMTGGGAVADFNRDGWQDLFTVTGGGGPDHLYLNNADGTFTDVAAQAGLARRHRGQGAVAADFNGDGWSDLFVTSYGPESLEAAQPGYHLLYRNNGDGTFTDVAVAAGVNFTSPTDATGDGGRLWRLRPGRGPGPVCRSVGAGKDGQCVVP